MNKNIIFLIVFFIFLITPFVVKGTVVINEIAWMGTENSANDEWIELYSNQETDLGGWVLEAEDGTPTINLEGTISADGYFLLERTDDNSVPGISADQIYTGALENSGEYLKLKNAEGDIVDEINASDSWPAGDNSTKQTMQLVNSEWLTGDPTPKAINNISSQESQEEPQETTQEPASAPQSGATAGTANQPPIADAGNDIIAFIDQEITFDGSGSYDPDGNELAYEWNLGEGGVKNDITVTHKYSFPGAYLVTLMVFDGRYYTKDTITVKIYPRKITINEFLPSPVGKDAEEEWIELYNDSDQIVDISGWQLDDQDGGSKPFTLPKNTLISPKGYLVFSRKVTNIALNNDTDKVRLLLSTGVVFQEVSYEKAPEGQSSARTPQGFVWSTPTPGLPNIIITGEQTAEYKESLQSETTAGQISEKTTLNYKKETPQGGWQKLPKNNQREGNQNYYQLANLEKSTGANNKLILLIVTIIIFALAAGIGYLKLKKKI